MMLVRLHMMLDAPSRDRAAGSGPTPRSAGARAGRAPRCVIRLAVVVLDTASQRSSLQRRGGADRRGRRRGERSDAGAAQSGERKMRASVRVTGSVSSRASASVRRSARSASAGKGSCWLAGVGAGRGEPLRPRRSPPPPSPLREQLLDAADRIAVLVEQAVDAPRQRDVVGPVIAAVAGALQRPQLREARLPIAQDVLRNAELGRKLADRPEGVVALADAVRPCRLQPLRAIRSRMI